MNGKRDWTSMVYAIIGLFAGLWWVDSCCRHDPDLYPIVSRGWNCAFQGVIMVILGGIGVLSAISGLHRRRDRDLIAVLCGLVMILGAGGILYGLWLVFFMCLVGCYFGETWGYWSLIGWLVAAVCALYIASFRFSPE